MLEEIEPVGYSPTEMKPKVVKVCWERRSSHCHSVTVYLRRGHSAWHLQVTPPDLEEEKEWLLVREDEAVRHLHFVRLIQEERWLRMGRYSSFGCQSIFLR